MKRILFFVFHHNVFELYILSFEYYIVKQESRISTKTILYLFTEVNTQFFSFFFFFVIRKSASCVRRSGRVEGKYLERANNGSPRPTRRVSRKFDDSSLKSVETIAYPLKLYSIRLDTSK